MSKLRNLSSELLPHDVVVDILTRLPVKSLIRFRCVSKSWYSTITDPIFITKHFNHNKAKSLSSSSNNNHNGFLLYICNKQLLCTAVCNGDPKLTLTSTSAEVSRFQIPFSVNDFRIRFCNGMFLIMYGYGRDRTICLWNPSIQKFKMLADTPNGFAPGLGLAYHPQNNDFKIFIFGYPVCYRKWPLFEVKVYTLNTNLWRRVEFSVESVPNFGSLCIIQSEPFLFCNGALHFVAYTRDNNFILSFDVSDEIFREIRLPENYLDDSLIPFGVIHDYRLAVFKGSLALIFSYIAEDEDGGVTFLYVIWVMRQYGVVESWTKKTVEVKSGQKFFGCTDSGQLLFQMSGRIVSYDPESRKECNIEIPTPYWLGYTTNLMESLVLLDHK